MGSRQLVIILLSIMVLPGCFINRKIYITSCSFTENSLIIEIEYKNAQIFKIKDVSIYYKDVTINEWFSEGEEVTYYKTDSKIVISLDLTDRVLCSNEVAELEIGVSGGFIYGDITIKDTTSNNTIYYTFPNEAYNNLSISITEQGYGLGI